MSQANPHSDGHAHHDDHGGHGADHHPHVVPLSAYFGVWLALLLLTAITVGVSYVNFGPWNLVVALVVATIKASLVALIFMHLLWGERFNAVVLVSSVVFLGIFIMFTRFDVFGRGLSDPIKAEHTLVQLPAAGTTHGQHETAGHAEKAEQKVEKSAQ
jgi:cytochrome c oxidase subunit 4